MINYETYCKIRLYHRERGLSFSQIGRELGLDPETVARYARMESFPRRRAAKRPGKLDAFKPLIVRWLERHPYSAAQIYQKLREEHGYAGGYSILKDYVRAVRPSRRPAYLSLAFAPGEAAQIDWAHAGTITLGATRRRLSFFAMVLCHSRMAWLEFTCGEAMEHFLGCQRNALEYFGGTPAAMLIDNLKTGVLSHRFGQPAVFHPRYLDFAAHYGFTPRACNVRKANEKGQVENFVRYVKNNFLAGLDLPSGLDALNVAARRWLEEVANRRIHKETRKPPRELFALEAAVLRPLPPLPADTSVARLVRVTNRCRVLLDTNRYSVPALYASQRLTLHAFADRICLYHAHNLVASHPRSYERHRDFEDPDHVKELLERRRRARDARWLLAFYALCPEAEDYHRQLCARSLQARLHVNRIVALADVHGREAVARAIRDAAEAHAFSSQYIENILQQHQRHAAPPGPLHLTRRSDLLELELPPADLSSYQPPSDQP
jgi:transposase